MGHKKWALTDRYKKAYEPEMRRLIIRTRAEHIDMLDVTL